MIELWDLSIVVNKIIRPRPITAPGTAYPSDMTSLMYLFKLDFVNFSTIRKNNTTKTTVTAESIETDIELRVSSIKSKKSIWL